MLVHPSYLGGRTEMREMWCARSLRWLAITMYEAMAKLSAALWPQAGRSTSAEGGSTLGRRDIDLFGLHGQRIENTSNHISFSKCSGCQGLGTLWAKRPEEIGTLLRRILAEYPNAAVSKHIEKNDARYSTCPRVR